MLITEVGKRGRTEAFIAEGSIVLVQDRVDKVVVTMSGGAEVVVAMTFDAFMQRLNGDLDEEQIDDED